MFRSGSVTVLISVFLRPTKWLQTAFLMFFIYLFVVFVVGLDFSHILFDVCGYMFVSSASCYSWRDSLLVKFVTSILIEKKEKKNMKTTPL